MKHPEGQSDRAVPLSHRRISGLSVLALGAGLIAGCSTQPMTSPSSRPRPVRMEGDSSTIYLRGEQTARPPTQRETDDYHRQRGWEKERQLRALFLEIELFRDQLQRLLDEGAPDDSVTAARAEVRWRMGVIYTLLCEPGPDNAGF